MHVIVQAGGKGTRLEGLTRNRPKCLVPVNNRPMIFWTFEAFKDHDITVICDYKEDALKRISPRSEPNIAFRLSLPMARGRHRA